jgi:hypothetical protein
MKRAIVVSILLCIFTLTILLYCQELTHKIYWLTKKKDYFPVDWDEVAVCYSEESEKYSTGTKMMLCLWSSGKRGIDLVAPVKLASVEIKVDYPGISDSEVLEVEAQKIAGSIGGNLVDFIRTSKFEDTEKFSGASVCIYRWQYKNNKQVLPKMTLLLLVGTVLENEDNGSNKAEKFIEIIENSKKLLPRIKKENL